MKTWLRIYAARLIVGFSPLAEGQSQFTPPFSAPAKREVPTHHFVDKAIFVHKPSILSLRLLLFWRYNLTTMAAGWLDRRCSVYRRTRGARPNA